MPTETTIFRTREEQRVEADQGSTVPELLRTLYHERGLSQQDIADRLRVSRATVRRWMVRYQIPTGYNRSGGL